MEKTARVFACERVALGHNADDNLETVILNLSRGAGLRGLAGIPIRRGRFVRPLLDIGRHELRQYLRGRSIPWMEDETNADLRFRRNLVRDRVTPVLRQLNPEVAGNVRRMSDVLVAEDAELERQASRGVGGAVTARGRRTLIDTVKLGQYNDCLKRRILRLLVPELDAAGTERLLEFVAGGRTGRLDLTSGVRARATERSIELTRSKGNS
jgi:tRNA(Ile)-lysidine synthase